MKRLLHFDAAMLAKGDALHVKIARHVATARTEGASTNRIRRELSSFLGASCTNADVIAIEAAIAKAKGETT